MSVSSTGVLSFYDGQPFAATVGITVLHTFITALCRNPLIWHLFTSPTFHGGGVVGAAKMESAAVQRQGHGVVIFEWFCVHSQTTRRCVHGCLCPPLLPCTYMYGGFVVINTHVLGTSMKFRVPSSLERDSWVVSIQVG